MNNEEIKNQIDILKQDLEKIKQDYSKHQHDSIDGTNTLRKNIILDQDQILKVGLSDYGSAPILNIGTTAEQLQHAISVGKDTRVGFVNKADVLQLNFFHQPNNTLKQSFITGVRGPVVTPQVGQVVSTTIGGSTITINDFNFTEDELENCYISIVDSNGTPKESQKILSNTSTVITIDGTWLNTVTDGTFHIDVPPFLGSSNYIWERVYVNEGTSGGIRFGVGPTGQGQNVLLYTDATGALMIRDKAGTSSAVGGGSTKAGKINSDGTASSVFPTGWTVSKTATGTYTVVHNLGTTAYAVVATAANVSQLNCVVGINTNNFQILVEDTTTGADTDAITSFIFSQ